MNKDDCKGSSPVPDTRLMELLTRATQIDRLNLRANGLVRRVINRQSALIEPEGLGLERYSQSAAAAGCQAKGAIVGLRVVAAHSYSAGEINSRRFRIGRIVKERDRLLSTRTAYRQISKIKARARSQPKWT